MTPTRIPLARLCSLAVLGLLSLAPPARADVKLASLFSDHAVFQRNAPVPVWGWADANEAITVRVAGQEKAATAGADGKWRVALDPLSPGEPLTMTVAGKNTLTVRDVLVGEVWLASGQSNMQFDVRTGNDGARESASANDPMLRMYKVPPAGNLEPQADPKGTWQVAAPGQIAGWSAVGYYYAKELRRSLGVPVGVIHSSYGGTPAEAWTSLEALSADPVWKATAEREIDAVRHLPDDVKAFPGRINQWLADNGAADPGNAGFGQGWAKPDFDDSTWKTTTIPVTPAKLGMKGGGVIWLRRSFQYSPAAAAAAAAEVRFNLNFISDADAVVYLNGVGLKELSRTPKSYTTQRVYTIPTALLKADQPNEVAVRIHAFTLNGGFTQTTGKMGLPVADPKALDDVWKYAVEASFPPIAPEVVKAIPKSPTAAMQLMSSGLFNQMIHPLIPYRIAGAIWYQGENNTNPTTARAVDYRRLLPAMIADWRGRWGEGDFPFYIVQLANYGGNPPQPAESNWATLRESQAVAAATVPNTGLAVAIDVGEGNNIHPKNKQEVGRRLSLLALHRTYGRDVADSGPTFAGMTAEDGSLRLKFSDVGGGLVAKGGPLKYFAVAGDDHRFAWADARIDGDAVVVSSPAVPKPTAARYAWADDPEGCNLYNAAGLPAVPFRTDVPGAATRP